MGKQITYCTLCAETANGYDTSGIPVCDIPGNHPDNPAVKDLNGNLLSEEREIENTPLSLR